MACPGLGSWCLPLFFPQFFPPRLLLGIIVSFATRAGRDERRTQNFFNFSFNNLFLLGDVHSSIRFPDVFHFCTKAFFLCFSLNFP